MSRNLRVPGGSGRKGLTQILLRWRQFPKIRPKSRIEDPEQFVANAVWQACRAIVRAFHVPEILLFATTINLHNGSLNCTRQMHPAVSCVIVPALWGLNSSRSQF